MRWWLICFLPFLCQGQQSALDKKYQSYRDRFNQEFIFINWDSDGIGQFIPEKGWYEEAGTSIPSSGKFSVQKANTYWEYDFANCKDNFDVTERPDVQKWADGTLHLGCYWAVLATEYALAEKRQNKSQRDSIAHELFLALQAYRRLDMTGQQIAIQWNQKEDCDHNIYISGYSGFFARDDVPRTFYTQTGTGGIVSSMACRTEPLDFFKKVGKGNVISQDQNAMLLFGLAFIHKCIPDSLFQFKSQQYNLRSIARRIAIGLVSHVHDSSFRNIRFPKCRGGKVQTGGNSIVYAFAMKKVLDFMVPGHRIRSSLFDRFSWELFAEDIGVIFAKRIGLAKNDNIGMYLTYCVSADMESMKDVVRISSSASQKEIFPFAKAFVHDHPLSSIPEELHTRFKDLLNACPLQGTGADAKGLSSEWHYDNRWRTYGEKPPYKGRGNGLDFMLAANLFRLLFEE